MVSLISRLASLGRQTSTTTSRNLSTSRFASLYYSDSSSYLSPRHLFIQIILLQSLYYGIGFVLILFTCIVSGRPAFSYKLVFSWVPVRSDTTVGWTLCIIWLLDTFFSVVALTVIVGRSKLALDFTLTLHGIHFMVCWITSGKFPKSGLWWALMLTSIVLMVTLGTWTSQWRELRRTFFENALEGASDNANRTKNNTGPPKTEASSSTTNDQADTALLSQYNEYELQDMGVTPDTPTKDVKGKGVKTGNHLKLGSKFTKSDDGQNTNNMKGSKESRLHLEQEVNEGLRNDVVDDDDDGDLGSLLKK